MSAAIGIPIYIFLINTRFMKCSIFHSPSCEISYFHTRSAVRYCLCTQTYIIMLPYFYISYKNLHACPFPFRICPCSVSVSLPEAVFLLRKFQHKHKHTPFPVRWCKDCFIVNRNLFPAQFKQYFVKMLFIHTAEYHKALLWCAAGKWCCEHVLRDPRFSAANLWF